MYRGNLLEIYEIQEEQKKTKNGDENTMIEDTSNKHQDITLKDILMEFLGVMKRNVDLVDTTLDVLKKADRQTIEYANTIVKQHNMIKKLEESNQTKKREKLI